MRLADARGAYEALSGKASDIVRQISLAGVGLIWVFKSASGTSISLEPQLLRAAFFIFLALSSDFFQYVLGTTIWFIYYRYKERTGTKETDEFLVPSQLNWPMWCLFYFKSAMMLVGYACYLVPFLYSKVRV
jgi:hypothetical protein